MESPELAPVKLSVSGLTKYFGDLEVLRDVSTNVRRGEFISIVGPSGCGKTTFLRIIGGLEQSDSGEARHDIGFADASGQTPCHFKQHFITGQVPKAVVEQLETVDIEQQQRERRGRHG